MSAVTFDTLGYFEKLKAAGVPESQAKVQTEALRDIVDNRLVTREYLDIRLNELESRVTVNIIKWVAGMLVAQAAVIAALVKLL